MNKQDGMGYFEFYLTLEDYLELKNAIETDKVEEETAEYEY
jgi:hypothetical protein